jgi:rfaE bifunctional protein nucleotidyltransferase chain/domain
MWFFKMRIKENKKDKKIVFVSGVFDILHHGHVDFLRRAKSLVGEQGKLVVAVHDDESVRAHKGADRPINGLNERVQVLKAIRYVDEVVPWIGWENVSDYVKELKPNYIAVSGNEYKKKSISSTAEEIGAKVISFPKIQDISTSKLIELINSK